MKIFFVLFCSGILADPPAEQEAAFRDRVAPAVAAKCIRCHSGDNAKGGLDLSTREGMLKGGESGTSLTPGKPEQSPAWSRSIGHNGNPPEMPEKGDPLTSEEAQALKDWIAAGAHWPQGLIIKEKARADRQFWSFQPIRRADPPEPAAATETWSRHPVDRFVRAKAHERGLDQNPPADPVSFLRRASYDLTGLPPTPEEVTEFVADCRRFSPDGLPDQAVEIWIDRLLASPHYGERWGRHWLDVVRFGESRGFERNEIITNLWPFRDYVISSLNEDKPFDRFLAEHLAGDVLKPDDPAVVVGSAFLVAGPYDDVGNQDAVAAAQIRADQLDEMIRATGEAFLGLTIGCARCHDHKFDPLEAADYYALYATFSGTTHGPRTVASRAATEEYNRLVAPRKQRQEELTRDRDALQKLMNERSQQVEAEAAKSWTRPRISRYGTEEKFAPIQAKMVRLTVQGSDSDPPQAYRLDEFEIWTDGENSRNVALASLGGVASGSARIAKDFSGAYDVSLVNDGKFGERWFADSKPLVLTLAKPERIRRVFFSSDRTRALGEDYGLTTFVGDYSIEVSLDGTSWTEVANSNDRVPPSNHRKSARLITLANLQEEQRRLSGIVKELSEAEAALREITPLPDWWVGNHKSDISPAHVFRGGNPQRRGEEVVPASLRVLSHLPSRYALNHQAEEGVRRIALAEWITSADNPLTPRVLANRVWQFHFGTGIVDTPSDFGWMGSRPTHPELLDWLSTELIRNEWRLKPLHRLIMTSQTYRQSAAWRESQARIDGDSRLLWRFPPRRLSAEEIRDTMLLVAGSLDTRMTGPGYRLYEYLQDNVATYVPLDRHGPETYRRAVYHHNARAAPVDVMSDFDCPDPAFAAPRRASTTSPLQALTLMNHQFTIDMSTRLGQRLEREADQRPIQVARAFQLVFSRDPSPAELEQSLKLIGSHGLRIFCRALLNSNELISIQ